MPITNFSSFDDGLEPGKRGSGNFIANVEFADDRNGYRTPKVSGSSHAHMTYRPALSVLC